MSLNPYLAYAKKNFLKQSAYRFDHFMRIVSTCLQIFIYWEIYKSLYGNHMEVDGITFEMVTTNFVLSLGLSAGFYIDDFYLPSKIMDGSLATELLRPISFRGRMLAENLGNSAFNLLFRFAPACVVAVIMVGITPPKSPVSFLLFLVSAVLGYGVLWAISFSVQMIAFWLMNIWSIVTIKNVFINVLSGSMIPLWFMPEWMQGVLKWTPFSSIYFTPVQIYLGQLSSVEIAEKCVIQGMWIVLLYGLGSILWKAGQRKIVIQGG